MRPAVLLRAGAALLLIGTAGARADSGLLGGPRPGTQDDPRGLIPDLARDPNGLSLNFDETRTPTGLLYPLPFAYPDMTQSKSDPDWWSYGWIDGGLLGTFGKTNSAQFREYGDWSNGLMLSSLGFLGENRKTAFYVSANAQDVGRDDQTYQLKTGRYGVFNVTLFFDATPHFFSTEAKSLWNGIGTANLTLKDGLVPAASTAAQVDAALSSTGTSDLKVTRDKAGFAVNYKFDDDWQAVFQLSNEWRNGTQPIGATFGYPFQNGATQIVQPIHYTTLDVTGALRYSGDETQLNLTYSGSLFHDNLQAVSWQNPGLSSIAGPGVYVPPEGRLSLPPSNEYHSLKADLSDVVTPQLRFSSSLTYSIMRQNDSLLPPTVNDGVIRGVATAIDLSQWDTTAALSQQRAHAAIDIFRAFAQLEYTPSSDVTLDFTLKDNNEDNRTNYLAFNPLTGQYGYIAIDGGLAAFNPKLSGVYEPNVPGSLTQIRNVPYANDNLEFDGDAAYRLTNHLKLDLSYTHNNIRHSDREVPDADDDRARLQLVSTGNSWGTVRASYEFASLDGSDYTSNPYTAFYSSALPGYVPATAAGDPPFTLSNLRKFDVGNRIEHALKVQSNFIVSPKTDLQLSGDLKSDAYDAQYGLRAATAYDATASFAYQLSLSTTLNAFYSFQFQDRSVANINALAKGTSGAAGSIAYPLANAWSEKERDLDSTLGATLHQSFDDVSLDLNYTFTSTTSTLAYLYASTGAFFNSLTPAEAGNQFPNIDFRYQALEANLRWQYSRNLAVRLFYRLDYQDLNDFHYTGLAPGVITNNIYLGVVPENYTAQAVGTFVQYTF